MDIRKNGRIKGAGYRSKLYFIGLTDKKDDWIFDRINFIISKVAGIMPSLKASFAKALRSLDLFPTSNFVRYSGDSDYTTSTGGLTSVVVITIFIILFASMGIRTANKEIITSEQFVQNDA